MSGCMARSELKRLSWPWRTRPAMARPGRWHPPRDAATRQPPPCAPRALRGRVHCAQKPPRASKRLRPVPTIIDTNQTSRWTTCPGLPATSGACARRPRSEAKVALGTTRVQDTQDAADRRLARGAARASPAASIQPVSRPCSHLPPPSAVLALVRARKSTTAARTWIAAPPEAAQLRGRPREAPHPRAQHLDDLSSCSPPSH